MRIKRITATFLAVLISAAAVPASLFTQALSYSGKGTMADPYLVTNAEQLQGMRENLSAHYKLADNIDLSGMDFKPIGRLDDRFKGSFVCELNADKTPKYVIKNLTINVPKTDYISENRSKWEAALFGGLAGATLQGIYVLDAKINNEDVGGNTGSVTYGDYNPGQSEMPTAVLAGKADNSVISNCGVTGTVTGKSNGCAGLIDVITNSTVVENCYASVNITTTGLWTCGGFIAYAQDSTISNCFSTGNVNTEGFNGGAFSDSFINATVSDCYTTGNINGSRATFVSSVKDSKITNCLALGNAQAQLNLGEAPKGISNCWMLSGNFKNANGFSEGSAASIKAAFSGLGSWDVSKELPTLNTIGVVTDASKYVPGANHGTTSGGSSGSQGNASTSQAGTAESTASQVDSSELLELVNKLPDPDVEDNVTLECKEDAVKAWKMYNALSAGQKDDFGSAASAKLMKVRYQLSVKMAGDFVTAVQKLPEISKLKDKDVEKIMALWDDYEFLDESIKEVMDDDVKEKIEKAHDFAVKAAQTTKGKTVITTVQRKLTGSEIFLTVLYSVIIAGAVFFDVFVGIKLIKNRKLQKQVEDGGSV